MSKKMCKRIFSVILSLGLVMVQSMNVNAAGNEIGKYSVFVKWQICGADRHLFGILKNSKNLWTLQQTGASQEHCCKIRLV